MLAGLLALISVGCNSDGEDYTIPIDDTLYSAAYVNSFRLAADTSVLVNLDTIFFTIDLDGRRIFNADSLPKGTKTNALIVNIGLPNVSQAKLIVPGSGEAKPDTIDYLEHSTDSINFSRGPVTLRVVSLNSKVTADYSISVNVHNELTDTLVWNQTAQSTLPTSLSRVTAQGTVEVGDNVVCITTDGTSFARAVTTDPYAGQWETSAASLPAGAMVQTLNAVGSTIYVATEDGRLYSSTDSGSTWTATGASMNVILGANGTTLLGLRRLADGTYAHVTYPATTETAADASFPVAGMSQAVQYVSDWASQPMTVIVGGTTASGDVSGATWAYDGNAWARISNTPLPDLTGVTVFPYFTFRIDAAWVASRRDVLMAIGGKSADGTMNRTTYVSYDQGVNWTTAGRLLNLPPSLPDFEGAQAIIRDTTLTPSRALAAWRSVSTHSIPSWLCVAPAADSRAVRPIEEWECPYIYLFGGYDAAGTLGTDIWRGVINRLTFKPIQ